jgi:hypothetical protein
VGTIVCVFRRVIRTVPTLRFGWVVALMLACPSPALADEWPITPTEPAPGASIAAATTVTGADTEPAFQFDSPGAGPTLANITVWSRNPSEPGNLFPEESAVGDFNATPSPVDPSVYRGHTYEDWPPGTYYWRATGTVYTSEPGNPFAQLKLTSPVFTFTVTAPPAAPAPSPVASPPALTLPESYAAVKEIIQNETGHSAHHLHDRCRLANEIEATCEASWFTARHVSSSTLLYAGSFDLWQEPEGTYFSFSGLRERFGCSKRFGPKRCASKVYWR